MSTWCAHRTLTDPRSRLLRRTRSDLPRRTLQLTSAYLSRWVGQSFLSRTLTPSALPSRPSTVVQDEREHAATSPGEGITARKSFRDPSKFTRPIELGGAGSRDNLMAKGTHTMKDLGWAKEDHLDIPISPMRKSEDDPALQIPASREMSGVHVDQFGPNRI